MGNSGWRKSRYSGQSENCVEVAPAEGGVLVRDTKDHGTGPVIRLTHREWEAFLLDVRIGVTTPRIEHHEAGTDLHSTGTTLHFTPDEWIAFRSGVLDGEFDLAAL